MNNYIARSYRGGIVVTNGDMENHLSKDYSQIITSNIK